MHMPMMRTSCLAAAVALAAVVVSLRVALAENAALAARANEQAAAAKADKQLGHMVYFSLNDVSAEATNKVVEGCKKYLAKHPGVVYFAAGTLAEDCNRPVNDRDWHVALHLVFADKTSHDKYQDAPDHLKFIDEFKDLFKKVRVFDSYVEGATAK